IAATALVPLALLMLPVGVVATDKFAPSTLVLFGTLAVALQITWWGAVALLRRPLSVKGFSLQLPSPWLALRQLLIGMADLTVASLVLFLPLSQQLDISYPAFLLLFLLAQLTGLASQVPGGIGVFEGSFLFLMPDHYASSQVLAALLVYRVIYYFVPLLLGGLVLLGYELRHNILLQSRPARTLYNLVQGSVPQIFSILLLLAGALLLFSGATPGDIERIHWLRFFLPLPLLEFSHLVGSIAGLALLFLARAVLNRIDAAYFASIIVLSVGIIASLTKGLDYEEAIILGIMLLAFAPTKRHFYRKSALLQLDLSNAWLSIIGVIVLVSIWVGFLSYQQVDYSHDLWWRFSFHGDASRFLRSLFALGAVIAVFCIYRLMTHIPATLTLPDAAELERATAIVRNARDTTAHLALLGDKYFMWSDSGNSFLMFDITRKFWIVMGDPLGAAEEHADLVWKLRELADRHGARVAFYQVGTQDLPLYLDLGLALSKLGEEAKVDLTDFSLSGKRRANLRHSFNKVERDGAVFEVVLASAIEPVLDELQRVSASWMANKTGREKRFSLGFFSRDYLSRGNVAVVKMQGRIVAFANLWELDNKNELSIDLMRYDLAAPSGVMEYLTLSIMLWGREQGYSWFNLGMAPLSGMEQHPLAPLWHKIGNRIFRFGQEFYNFEGLHRYKDKFDPVWQPRYLAAPAGLSMASVLLAVTTLISGGIKGIFAK
ncbi:MAG TPA: bifunctional lysylphosphatidylglycerol flippase/synthetase MprF, partial [Spongiibacteraceae bacterium]|nr:bifunctional lysylphosphatidylglycerol flippase/synthetase MprF [Spongiibacteraceae bacterium]